MAEVSVQQVVLTEGYQGSPSDMLKYHFIKGRKHHVPSPCLRDSRTLHCISNPGWPDCAAFLVRIPEGRWPLTLGHFCSKFLQEIQEVTKTKKICFLTLGFSLQMRFSRSQFTLKDNLGKGVLFS